LLEHIDNYFFGLYCSDGFRYYLFDICILILGIHDHLFVKGWECVFAEVVAHPLLTGNNALVLVIDVENRRFIGFAVLEVESPKHRCTAKRVVVNDLEVIFASKIYLGFTKYVVAGVVDEHAFGGLIENMFPISDGYHQELIFSHFPHVSN